MRVVSIMQPTYLPWAGYFNMMHLADVFVFLDDVRFEPRAWQQRNRVLVGGEPRWLTVPVAGGRDQAIRDVLVDDAQPWKRRHIHTIRHAYGNHPFFADVIEPISKTLGSPERRLGEINISLIESFASIFGIRTPLHRASEIDSARRKSERLLDICLALGATEFLSARGSRQYLEEEGVFAAAGMPVRYHGYEPGPYAQKGVPASFVSHLSIVDVIANLGATRASTYAKQ